MNRLTQKLVAYLVNMPASDRKFGLFLVGILFGDEHKAHFGREGLSPDFRERKAQFADVVNAHLEAAEHLSRQEPRKEPDDCKCADDFDPEKHVNKRLGSFLYPPERARKFESIFQKKKTGESPAKERHLSCEATAENLKDSKGRFPREKWVARKRFLEDRSGFSSLEEAFDGEERAPVDYVDFSRLPREFYYHWQFLESKVLYYQKRLKSFYKRLNELALKKRMAERQGFRRGFSAWHRRLQAENYSPNRGDFERRARFLGKRDQDCLRRSSPREEIRPRFKGQERHFLGKED